MEGLGKGSTDGGAFLELRAKVVLVAVYPRVHADM